MEAEGRNGQQNGRYLDEILDMLESADQGLSTSSEYWDGLEARHGSCLFSEILFHLTRMDFDPDLARVHWEQILATWSHMSEKLGRRVGLPTAVCDYFLSLNPLFEDPMVVETRLLVRNEECAMIDDLTGLGNRRFFSRELKREMERSKRSGLPFSLLLVDIDRFKAINDRYGHLVGDAVLKDVAKVLRHNAREVDLVARYGGEEFALVLPEADRDEAFMAAERHREALRHHEFVTSGSSLGSVTISIGVATYPMDAEFEMEMVAKADRALYSAKESGRNRVCTDPSELRRSPRFPVSIDAVCSFPEGDQPPVECHTLNISLNGLLVSSSYPMEVGKRVVVELKDTEYGTTLTLIARSVHHIEKQGGQPVFHVGMAFEHPGEAKKLLSALISRHLDVVRG